MYPETRNETESEELKDKVSAVMTATREEAQEIREAAARTMDEKRQGAANALEGAATKMRKTTDAGSQKLSAAGESAAQGMESTAHYLRSHDTQQMMADVEKAVRSYPGRSLLIAAGVGFLVGRAFRND